MIKKLIKLIDEKIDLKKFTKFGITGLINTGVDWLAFAAFVEIFNMQPRFAQVIAQSIAIINSYIINKNWTFKNNKVYKKSEVFKFLLVQGISLCISYISIFILHDNLGLNEYLSRIPVAVLTIIINYFGNKLFVFK